MWFGASRVTGIGVGGSGSLVGGVSAFVRHFSRKRAENLRKINPRVPPQEANFIARDLYDLIKQKGPLTVSDAWVQAQETGIGGLSSKTHLKLLFKWMRGRKMLKLLCNHVGSNKKFLLCTPEDAIVEQAKMPSDLKLKTGKPSKKRRKKTK